MKCVKYILLICVLFFAFTSHVFGVDESIADSFQNEWDTFTASLPENIQPLAEDAFHSPDGIETIRNAFSIASVWGWIQDALDSVWPSAVGLLLQVIGILIFMAVFHRVQEGFSSENLRAAAELCSTLCLVLCCTPIVLSSTTVSEQFLTLITSCTSGITPVVCALFVSSGNLTTAAVTNASLMLVYTLFQNVVQVFLFPIIRAIYVLGIVGNLGGLIRLGGVSRCVRRVFTWILSITMLVVSVLIGVQGAMALSVDSFSMKTAKFALGNFIPLVGGAISDAVGTVAGSLSLIKSTCGVIGVWGVLLLLLPVILHLILHRAVIGVGQGVAELLGCEREGKLLAEVHGILGYMLAVVALVSVLFVFVLALIISVRF